MSGSGGNCTGLSWSYDAWGNRTAQTPTGGTCNQSNLTFDANNRITTSGFTYDADGNVTYDGVHHYYYDAENRLIQTDGTPGTCSTAAACYFYDTQGRRVQKIIGSGETSYLYDLDGKVMAEVNSGSTVLADYVYAGGSLIAQYKNSTLSFVHDNNLGSSTVLINTGGAVVECDAYYPFGELDSTICGPTNITTHKFTGKERDTESNLDNFGARYYSSAMARFMTADWSANEDPVPYAKLENPQTLNLYGYVLNNPLSSVDNDGHKIIYASNLKNPQLVMDTVQAIHDNPHTSAFLAGYEGENNPNLIIQSGDLSKGDTTTRSPDGQTLVTTTVQGETDPGIQTTTLTDNGVSSPPVTTLNPTITIDNRTSKGDTPGVLVHESVHAGEARANPTKFAADAKAEKSIPNHDQRPQEQRANAAQKAYGSEIKKAVKQIEKVRKKDSQ
jgi:RHS repeat-associated protein